MFRQESLYWWSQRIFSIALIPLSIWLIMLFSSIFTLSYFSTISIVTAFIVEHHVYLILLFGLLTSLHIRLGLEEVVEDYIHDEKIKLILSISLRILAIRMVHDLYIWATYTF